MLSEPASAQLIGSGTAQERAETGGPAAKHPAFTAHPIQGWTPDFIPLVLQETIERGFYDVLEPVSGPEAIDWARKLASQEGIFCGISSGATFAAAMRVAETAPAGSVILCMLPDTGERYLSTLLFEGIPENMSDEEVEISRSVA